jgi:WD40 repeat protein
MYIFKKNKKQISFFSLACLLLLFANDLKSQEKAELFVALGHSMFVTSVDVSPNGKYLLSGSKDNTLKLWDISKRKEIRTLKGHTKAVNSVVFSPDGKYALSGSSDGSLKLWEISKGQVIRTFKGHSKSINSVVFSPDGKYALSGSSDGSLKLWEISKGQVIRTFKGHSKRVTSVDFSPDGKYALSGSSDGSLKLWEISKGQVIRTFKGHSEWVTSVDFSPDGKYALSGSGDKSLKLWEISKTREIKTLREHSMSVENVVFMPNGKQALSLGWDGLVLWNLSSGQVIRKFNAKKKFDNLGRPMGIALSKNGNHAYSAGRGFGIELWNTLTGSKVTTIEGSYNQLRAISINPDGKHVVAGYWDNTLNFWDISTGQLTRTLKKQDGIMPSISTSPDGKYLLSGDLRHKTIKLWEISTGQLVRSFWGHSRGMTSVAFSPDGKYALTGNGDKTVKYWDISTGKVIRTLKGIKDIGSVDISPDGRYALSSGCPSNKLWDLSTGTSIMNFGKCKSNRSYPSFATFSHNGKYIITGSKWDRNLILWDSMSGKKIRTFRGHKNGIWSATFSNDDKYVASGSADNRIKLWELTKSTAVLTIKDVSNGATTLSFNINDKYVVGDSGSNTMSIWDVSSGKEVAKFVAFDNGEWIVITPEGYYNASTNGAKYLNIRIGNKIHTIDQLNRYFYRPDLVHAKLMGDPENLVAKTAEHYNVTTLLNDSLPPTVRFINSDQNVIKDRNIKIVIEINNQGGGIGRIEWRINGITIGLQESKRSIALENKKNNTLRLSKLLTLSPGKNNVEVVAYDKTGIFASDPVSLSLELRDAISDPPALYILSIGINKYRDKALWLNYAVPDGRVISKRFRDHANSIYKNIHITQLYDHEATMEKIAAAFKKISERDLPNDVFILYMAGHGITMDGRYHFLPVDFRYVNEDSIREKAINQDHLQKWLSYLDSKKSLLLLDTCNSGSYIQAQAITRGLAEKTAIDKLTRAIGRTTIAASSDSQVAFEGFKGHGVFTYFLINALIEADSRNGNRDSLISTSELASYVSEQVPNATYKKWGYEQTPQVNFLGMEFPIGVVK